MSFEFEGIKRRSLSCDNNSNIVVLYNLVYTVYSKKLEKKGAKRKTQNRFLAIRGGRQYQDI